MGEYIPEREPPIPDMPTILEYPQCSPKCLHVVPVGMGASGLLFAYKPRKVHNLKLVGYERNDTVGGTWLENRCPGCVSFLLRCQPCATVR
jgi:4-hydroxyacetophenone monooxygenase